jgi:hypothetical protein
LSEKLRFSGKVAGQRQRPVTQPGILPGFSDAYVPYPYITNYGITVDYSISPTTFLEVTYGRIQNQLAGGNENGITNNPESNRLKSLKDFPMLYPDAGVLDPGYYGYGVMQKEKPPFWDGKSLNLPPIFGWGSGIGAPPPNQRYPGYLNINRTQDLAGSLTKVAGRHTETIPAANRHRAEAQHRHAQSRRSETTLFHLRLLTSATRGATSQSPQYSARMPPGSTLRALVLV